MRYTMKKKIGLFGFGAVGQGFYQILKKNPHINAEISKVCIKRLDLERISHELYFTTNADELLEDNDIDIIVEVIDDAEAAKLIVRTALQLKKHVISANKKMIAESIEEVAQWHSDFEATFLYEAAVGGGIPIIHNIENNFRYQEITGIRGILNGSSNFILTKMKNDGSSYETALKEAQKLGFAETDPSLDVDGFDAFYKLIILYYHATGRFIDSSQHESLRSISRVGLEAQEQAAQNGAVIRQISQFELSENAELVFKVGPEEVKTDDLLAHVELENNAVEITTALSDKHLFFGKGAGSFPTGSSVFGDLIRLLDGYRYQQTTRALIMEKAPI